MELFLKFLENLNQTVKSCSIQTKMKLHEKVQVLEQSTAPN